MEKKYTKTDKHLEITTAVNQKIEIPGENGNIIIGSLDNDQTQYIDLDKVPALVELIQKQCDTVEEQIKGLTDKLAPMVKEIADIDAVFA
jgi:hypothetical protein